MDTSSFAVFGAYFQLDYVAALGSVNCAHFESRSYTAFGHVPIFTFDFTAYFVAWISTFIVFLRMMLHLFSGLM